MATETDVKLIELLTNIEVQMRLLCKELAESINLAKETNRQKSAK